MSDFRTRLLGLSAVATAFAGMSYGQNIIGANCGIAQGNPTLRAEGETELLAEYVATCINTQATATGGALYITTSLPITSKSIPVPMNPPTNEATLTVTVGGVAQAPIAGTVSGTQVAFTIPANSIPASTTSGGVFTLTVDNIRLNASGGGAPQVTETGLLSYTVGATSSNTSIGATPASPAGFILQTLGASALLPQTFSTNYTTCGGNPTTAGGTVAASTSFTLQIQELVGGAFKPRLRRYPRYLRLRSRRALKVGPRLWDLQLARALRPPRPKLL